MRAIKRNTRVKIKAYLEVFVENLVKEYRGRVIPPIGSAKKYLRKKSSKGQLKPFHAAIIPHGLLRINEFERGFSTGLGTTFEECARLIAQDHHSEAQRGYNLTATVSNAAVEEIDRQVSVLEHTVDMKNRKPSLHAMIEAVMGARRDDDLSQRTSRADLYILEKDGNELFFEMKSPMPNKGQCLEVTQRVLRFHLLRGSGRPVVSSYFAMAYNPYGPNRSDYRWSFALNYTPFDEMILLAQEFWELVGGRTAYEELIEIYREVGHEKAKYMVDALAFGF